MAHSVSIVLNLLNESRDSSVSVVSRLLAGRGWKTKGSQLDSSTPIVAFTQPFVEAMRKAASPQ